MNINYLMENIIIKQLGLNLKHKIKINRLYSTNFQRTLDSMQGVLYGFFDKSINSSNKNTKIIVNFI